MREVGNALIASRADRDLPEGWDELKDEPERQEDQRRYLNQRDEEDDEDQGEHPGAREEQRVRAQDARDRAAGADRRRRRSGIDQRLCIDRDQPRQDVEEEELQPSHSILDVVAEDPEEEHVPDD